MPSRSRIGHFGTFFKQGLRHSVIVTVNCSLVFAGDAENLGLDRRYVQVGRGPEPCGIDV